jgi:hypothetical protein
MGKSAAVAAVWPIADRTIMRRIALVMLLAVIAPSAAHAGCDWLDRLWFSAASPGYPMSEFWAPRWYRLHACHSPVSVNVNPPAHCDAQPGFVPVGPYCQGSQPHFPLISAFKPSAPNY